MEKLKATRWYRRQQGKIGYLIAWGLGVPVPILFLVFLLRGCE